MLVSEYEKVPRIFHSKMVFKTKLISKKNSNWKSIIMNEKNTIFPERVIIEGDIDVDSEMDKDSDNRC